MYRISNQCHKGATRTAVVGLVWIAVVLWLFLDGFKDSMAEAALMQRGERTWGLVVAASEEMERAESGAKLWYYDVSYRYQLPTGEVLDQRANGSGRLPSALQNLTSPRPVQVIYLPDNPSVSQIVCSHEPKAETWLVRKSVGGLLFLGLFLTPGIAILVNGIRERE